MKHSFIHHKYGKFVFTESEIFGKKRLYLEGRELTRISRKSFAMIKNGLVNPIFIEGNWIIGTTLIIDGEKIDVNKSIRWYEVVFYIFPIAFVCIWGNKVLSIIYFPVVGGFIGGAVSALISSIGLILSKKISKWYFKVLIGLTSNIVGVLLCHLIGLFILTL